MEINQLLEFGKDLAVIIFGGLCIYIQCNKKIQEKIAEITGKALAFIKEAESLYTETKQGGEKMKWVVEQLFELVPSPVDRIITKDMIEDIVQGAFDEMEAYTKEQLDKLINKG